KITGYGPRDYNYRDGTSETKTTLELDNGQSVPLNKTRTLQLMKICGTQKSACIGKIVNFFAIDGRMGPEIHLRRATGKLTPVDADPDLDEVEDDGDSEEMEARQATRTARRGQAARRRASDPEDDDQDDEEHGRDDEPEIEDNSEEEEVE